MHRRSFLLLSGAVATAPALDLLMAGTPALAAAQDGDRVSAQLTATVEQAVQQARELDDSEGSASTLLWAGGIWQNLGKLITESRYRVAEGVRLPPHTSRCPRRTGGCCSTPVTTRRPSASTRPDCGSHAKPPTHPASTGPPSTSLPPPPTRSPGWASTRKPPPCWTSRPTAAPGPDLTAAGRGGDAPDRAGRTDG
ncbi:hypothetical protein NKH18_18935 [Streptomyces sp. M10(2022)]